MKLYLVTYLSDTAKVMLLSLDLLRNFFLSSPFCFKQCNIPSAKLLNMSICRTKVLQLLVHVSVIHNDIS
jgi:hypothetical protein